MKLEYEANWLKGYLRAIGSMKGLVVDLKLQINDLESQDGIDRILTEIDQLKVSAEKHIKTLEDTEKPIHEAHAF